MCLIVARQKNNSAYPLILASNRDEFYNRPALPFQQLNQSPLLVGGLDVPSGGTWLAISASGIFVAITNQPLPHGPDTSKRSRGPLVLNLCKHNSLPTIITAIQNIDSSNYNPGYLLFGNSKAMYYHHLHPDNQHAPQQVDASDWIVLENTDLFDKQSPKIQRTKFLLNNTDPQNPEQLLQMQNVLADHAQPVQSQVKNRPAPLLANCVHTEPFGTRSSAIIAIDSQHHIHIATGEGPACRSELQWQNHLLEHDQRKAL